MDLESFQNQHGTSWHGIVSNPAYFAALQYCDSAGLKALSLLTPEQIRDNAQVHLAEFVGRLKLQNELLELSAVEPAEPIDLASMETYSDPEVERNQAITPSRPSNLLAEFQAEQATLSKRKYVKRKKRRRRRTKTEMLAAQSK